MLMMQTWFLFTSKLLHFTIALKKDFQLGVVATYVFENLRCSNWQLRRYLTCFEGSFAKE